MVNDNNSSFTSALTEAVDVVASGDDAARHEIDGLIPQLVACPSNVGEVSRALAAISRFDKAAAPWGGGSKIEIGNTPERLDVVIDLSRLNSVVEHIPSELTATVEAGITVARFQEILGEHGQFLAIDPPLPQRATVGGTLATGITGPMKWRYGSPRDAVIGIKVIQADGSVVKSGGRTVKNVSGYDMARLHVGGLGTLGIIGEVSLKLTPLPHSQTTILAAYDTTRDCMASAMAVFNSDVSPLAMVTFDREANEWIRAADLNGNSFLAIRLGGRPRTVERLVRECRSACREHSPSQVEVLEGQDVRLLWRNVADFGWAGEKRPALGCRASVLPLKTLELVETLQQDDPPDGLRPAILTHPAHGTVLSAWFANGDAPVETAACVVGMARNAARGLGGNMIVQRCPLEVKSSLDVWDDVGSPLDVMRRMKDLADPKKSLNPGRFAGRI